ncbi:lysophospholipid acyltransferase family protein [Streptomyces mutabilis]|uniref:lysophospholipid acyltransferase family protein n=1 Tax=Streptomyces TaxID=1883 RepID=UPI000BC730DD|nr:MULTISPECIES: lysophospholipid acyltransferase family protein [unclassified Streptomyces]MDN3249410.1 lysophospholipid acyltransferase family protein [Streptomyces sp. ZSW22]MDN3257673.1 lysophospholipid acyltransferase family protein [Streptomyces sp. MA25(2023)]MDQ0386235.1 1-acyl-sn-glycerol-3-phosphate acyltransferase [Streptomyces sp. DSM 42143]PAK23879.1 glycerol acyltransferase [Streptomyces sp. alain-838]
MADAKVIPFDDDRSRGSGGSGGNAAQRPARRRGAGSRRKGSAESVPVREVQPLPVRGAAEDDGAATPEPQGSPGARPDDAADGGLERRIAGGLAFLRRRLTGDYEVDDFGYDAELTDQVLMSMLRPVYEKYFRVEVKGVENIPAEGGALIVANHSGTLPLDGLMMQVAVHDHHPADRHLRLLAADLVFVLPVVNELARKLGHTLACAEDAERLLAQGELVGVMPEGFKGIGKPFSERYKLQRFGRGGFVSTALRQGAPIIPCSIVGAEEIYPMIGNAKTLARLLGFPYFPLTPTFPWLGPLGAVPLPTKWTIQFGEPIPTDGYPPEAAEDPMLMFNLTDQVREQIQHTLYKLLVQRRSVFF